MVSYKKLFKLLIDKEIKKSELMRSTRISPSTLAKMKRGENINAEVIAKICKALSCTPNDIMEIVE